MDKLKPEYPLEQIKSLIAGGQCKLTGKSIRSAHSLGFSETEAKDVVLDLERKDFYKSTNEFNNYKVWQDVYKKKVGNVNLYIKLKVAEIGNLMVLIMSFKKDDNLGREL